MTKNVDFGHFFPHNSWISSVIKSDLLYYVKFSNKLEVALLFGNIGTKCCLKILKLRGGYLLTVGTEILIIFLLIFF